MIGLFFKARGIATAALVLLICSACVYRSPAQPHPPRSLESALAALRTGDLERFRSDLGKGDGFAARADKLRESLDEPAWLVAVGAVEREYRMNLALPALRAGDDVALASALGFGEQALRADILNGGNSVEFRKSNGRKYFSVAPQPVDISDDVALPRLPHGALAIHVSLYGSRDDKHYRLSYGSGPHGVTNLQAMRELAIRNLLPAEDVAGNVDPAKALPRSDEWALLQLDGLKDPRWYGVRIHLLLKDATLLTARMGHDGGLWKTANHTRTTLAERLAETRDRRLEAMHKRAADFFAVRGEWPTDVSLLKLPAIGFIDPLDPAARLDWGRYADNPPQALKLGSEPPEGDVVAYSAHVADRGRRAITSSGHLTWLRP